MSITPFGRARRSYRIDESPDRQLMSAEIEILRRAAKRGFSFPIDVALANDDPCVQGIERRPKLAQERRVHSRCVRLLAVSMLPQDQILALRLAQCTPRRPCRSGVCWLCKYRFAKFRQLHAWGRFRALSMAEIAHVTVLARGVYGGIFDVETAIETAKKRVSYAIERATEGNPLFDRLEWIGYFEIDHYLPGSVDISSRKGKTLRRVDGFDLVAEQPLQLVHFHLLVALNGVPENELGKTLQQFFPGRWRVKVQPLTEKKGTMKESIYNLAAYMSKCHPCYQSTTMKASAKADVPNMNGRYDRVFADHDLLYYARLHAHLGGLGGSFKFDRGQW